MIPITNSKGDVLTRYVIEKVSGSKWDSHYSKIPPYKLISVEKTSTGKIISCNIIYRAPLFKEWLKEKEDSGEGFKCIFCKDTGLEKMHRDFCTCSLGNSARKAFGEKTNLEKDEEG